MTYSHDATADPKLGMHTASPSEESGELPVSPVAASASVAQAATRKLILKSEDDEPPAPPHWKTNVFLLILAWFLVTGTRPNPVPNQTVQFTHIAGTVAIAKEMAGDYLATLPNGLIFIGGLLSTMPLSYIGERYGLRVSYVVGTGGGLIGATLCLLAMKYWSFSLLCLGLLFQGTQQATTQLVRFGVRSVCPPKYVSRALSWVVAGAAVAAPIGPQITRAAVWLVPDSKYLGIYIILECIIFAMTLTVMGLRIPAKITTTSLSEYAVTEVKAPLESRSAIVRRVFSSKKYLIAVVSGLVSYMIMVLMMAPAPIAITNAGFTFSDQANVIMAHVLGMFAPSIFTGYLIDRFGSVRMNIIGIAILTLSIAILFAGEHLPVFYVGETLVGVGWNFSFVAASTTIAQGAKPGRELQTVQSVNDTTIQVISAIIVLPLYRTINWVPLAILGVAIIGLTVSIILAIMRLPIRGLIDDVHGLKGYKREEKDTEK
ncbi:MFS general substrate transporter [Gonapodya prolifera JEL478]|uniref:MFS general substrate transporter n=1 Tax=Gonapodya prolifera (strain JEL478) TaxID=1344416 RepID=A0A139AB42_GONPJ|nr:MFS general substrate transporter [Gonapodya prolifera JEL478]|eukprot:KXS14042.1 MFS general substrate transporter [Gonapodya prolifera JEL478]